MTPLTDEPFFLLVLGGACIAIVISFSLQGRLSRGIMRYGGIYFLIGLAFFLYLANDCAWRDMSFQQCRTLPSTLEPFVSGWWLIHLIAMAFVAPVLFIVSLISEVMYRRRQT